MTIGRLIEHDPLWTYYNECLKIHQRDTFGSSFNYKIILHYSWNRLRKEILLRFINLWNTFLCITPFNKDFYVWKWKTLWTKIYFSFGSFYNYTHLSKYSWINKQELSVFSNLNVLFISQIAPHFVYWFYSNKFVLINFVLVKMSDKNKNEFVTTDLIKFCFLNRKLSQQLMNFLLFFFLFHCIFAICKEFLLSVQ